MSRTLVLWCPDWPVTACGLANGNAADENVAVAVVEAGHVIAASAAARAGGVRAGTRRRAAEHICPDLIVAERDPTAEARLFDRVVRAVIADITPQVEVIRPGTLALEVRGPARYFGGEASLAELVLAVAAGTRPDDETNAMAPRVGIADTRFAARLAARRGAIVAAGHDAEFLAPFPVAALALPALTDVLVRLGIDTLGAFAALDAGVVTARFGAEATWAHRCAAGHQAAILQPEELAEPMVVATEIDPPAQHTSEVAFVARSLAGDLIDQLHDKGLGCLRVRLAVETEHGERLERIWRGEGLLRVETIIERLRWQLDGWQPDDSRSDAPTAGVSRLVITADEVTPAVGVQAGLWGGLSDQDRRAKRGVDRVSGMLGPRSVFTATLQGGRSPTDRFLLIPWGEPRPSAAPTAAPWPGGHPFPAPAVVHAPPIPTEVQGIDGQPVVITGRAQISSAPAWLTTTNGQTVAVTGWAGPWTVDERWWDPASSYRYARLQIVRADGRTHLCRCSAGQWQIEATYG